MRMMPGRGRRRPGRCRIAGGVGRSSTTYTGLKVLTLEMFAQWTKGKPFTVSQVLNHLERQVQRGGGIEGGRKCQGHRP